MVDVPVDRERGTAEEEDDEEGDPVRPDSPGLGRRRPAGGSPGAQRVGVGRRVWPGAEVLRPGSVGEPVGWVTVARGSVDDGVDVGVDVGAPVEVGDVGRPDGVPVGDEAEVGCPGAVDPPVDPFAPVVVGAGGPGSGRSAPRPGRSGCAGWGGRAR